MAEPRANISEILRGRVVRGLATGTLHPGDRLPSARALATEFAVEHRLILAAYRELAAEDLIEVRGRGGVYVASSNSTRAGFPTLPVKWFVDIFTEGFTHDIPASELHDWLRRSVDTVRLRVAVIATTCEQATGLARELRDDFGLAAEGLVASDIPPKRAPNAISVAPVPTGILRRADLLIVTREHVELGHRLATELAKSTIVIDVLPDLVAGDWALMLRHPVYAVVATADFGSMLRRFLAGVRGKDNLHVLVLGNDDLSAIPEGAPTYVTHRVRESLAGTPIGGRILPPARTIATASAREIFNYIVVANLAASHAVRSRSTRGPQDRGEG